MFQRTLSRTLSRYATPLPSLPCAACSCRCGAIFRNNGLSTEQRRTKHLHRAPSTRGRARRAEEYALTPEEVRKRSEWKAHQSSMHYRTIRDLQQRGFVKMTPDAGVAFLNGFAELAAQARGRNVVDVKQFQDLVETHALSSTELWLLSTMLLRSVEEDQELGKKLLFTLSTTGNEEATMRILNHALLGNKTQPGLLRSSEILYARGHLREVARKGENYRAMVLEGKIAYELGDDDYAIQMWSEAMAAAVAVSEAELSLRMQGKISDLRAMQRQTDRDLSELSTPWIELTGIHFERYMKLWQRNQITLALAELAKARSAMEIGCEQDDPTSHYHAAEFFKEFNADGSTKHTSSWLYHMTKAGASGHVKAAHALAEFYASTGWKYIEDEPPDHVKPTPFDSYPAPSTTNTTHPKATFNWRTLIGLSPPTTQQDPKEAIFHTVIFPSTPRERWTLAFRWLEPAVAYNYAPSYLLAAKMLLEKTLWSQAQAPASALNLTEDRYTYASKEAYETGHPINPPQESAPEPPANDEPNTHYDPKQAKNWLKQVFFATDAIRIRRQLLQDQLRGSRGKRSSNPGEAAADAMDEGNFDVSVPEHVKMWFRFPDVREMWEEEADQLETEAKAICEIEGWDIWDEEGGLVYKHGLGKVGAHAAAAGGGGG